MKRILVTGASGFLGWNICRRAEKSSTVLGVFNNHPLTISGAATEKCDLLDYASVKALLRRFKPDAVVHAAAAADPNFCQLHSEETRRINVDAAISLAGLCSDARIPCALISTDLVFDGASAPYNEACPPSPISIYGEQKCAAEQGMLSRHDRMTICRLPLMFGDVPSTRAELYSAYDTGAGGGVGPYTVRG